MIMQKFRLIKVQAIVLVAAFLIVPFSAFTFAPNTEKAPAHSLVSQAGHTILPGQELVFSHPLKDDPKAMLHLKLSRPEIAPFTSCDDNLTESEWITNAFGGTLASYTLELDFCYDGTHVTYMTDPPNQSWFTCCFWGMGSHSAYTHVYPGSGVGHGSFTFNGPFGQSWSGWCEIDVYGNGNVVGKAG